MRIAIVGAGIAGLTAAIALSRRRYLVDVYERAVQLREVGAGIQLSPNATAILMRLGLEARLRDFVCEPAAIEIRNGRSGALLARIPLGETARRRYGAPYYLTHRADLQAALLAEASGLPGVRLFFGCKAERVGQTGPTVTFAASGEAKRADLLIAADGVHSEIRTAALGSSGAQNLGKVAWRAAIAASAAPPAITRDATGLWLGPGAHLVHYPVSGGASLSVVVVSGPIGAAQSPPLAGFAAPARDLAAAVGGWTPWPLSLTDPSEPWSRGRIVLIGDAAHAMAPSAAQGGAQAIEDAWWLADCLAGGGEPSAALARFVSIRRPRVSRVARQALFNLKAYNLSGLAAVARDVAIAAIPPKFHLARLDWLYRAPDEGKNP